MESDNIVENLSNKASKKMKVGLVVDCIHSMERKLIKPKEKMLPAKLFDLQRFHNLKSKTGVESKELEKMLLEARIA